MIRTALYVRVSTSSQAEDGQSIPAQIDALTKYAKEHNYDVVGLFCDDGISATKFQEREKLQELISLIKNEKVDLVLVTKLDRLFRSLSWYIKTQELFNEYGVEWRAIFEPIYDTTTPQGRLITNQMMSISQFEAEHVSQRVKSVFDFKKSRKEVISGKIPFGYVIGPDKHMLIDEEKASAVRKAFDLYAETGRLCETMRLTQGLGLPTTQRAFRNMLMNRKYLGECYGIADYCEPIIDRNTFDTVQRYLKINAKDNQYYDYIFSGLFVCKDCGNKMMGRFTQNTQTRKRYYAYACFKHYRTIPDCINSRSVSELKFEKYLVKNLEQFAFSEVEVGKKKDNVDYGKLIEKTERKVARLKELFVNELITLDEYKRDLAEYTVEIEGYRSKLANTASSGKDALKDLIGRNVADWYWTLSNTEKRLLWRSVIDHITFDHNKNIEIFFK